MYDRNNNSEPSELETLCVEHLRRVLDPEMGLDVVSLGLIYELSETDGGVDVKMTMTSPGCPLVEQMIMEVQNQLLKTTGVEKARVILVWSPPWTPEMMSEEARMVLGID